MQPWLQKKYKNQRLSGFFQCKKLIDFFLNATFAIILKQQPISNSLFGRSIPHSLEYLWSAPIALSFGFTFCRKKMSFEPPWSSSILKQELHADIDARLHMQVCTAILIAKTCESFQECVLSHIGYWKVKHICCTVIEINWVQRNMPNLWTCNIAWSRGLVARGYSLPSVSLKSEYPGMIIGPHLSSILHKMSPKCSF